MRIPEYSALLYAGKTVELGASDDPFVVMPPSADDVEQGFDQGITASETIELHRALSAWLGMHKRLHGKWHDEYRRINPGSTTGTMPRRRGPR